MAQSVCSPCRVRRLLQRRHHPRGVCRTQVATRRPPFAHSATVLVRVTALARKASQTARSPRASTAPCVAPWPRCAPAAPSLLPPGRLFARRENSPAIDERGNGLECGSRSCRFCMPQASFEPMCEAEVSRAAILWPLPHVHLHSLATGTRRRRDAAEPAGGTPAFRSRQREVSAL